MGKRMLTVSAFNRDEMKKQTLERDRQMKTEIFMGEYTLREHSLRL